ncbi:MAG TPA: hypothetical protein V6C96_05025 [Vampirovibrionales bacterium]
MADSRKNNDLRSLSQRTDELLSRLNELSEGLSTPVASPPTTSNFSAEPPISQTKFVEEPKLSHPTKKDADQPIYQGATEDNIPDEKIYSLPVNKRFLEKTEKRIERTEEGNSYITKSSTSIFREEHHIHNSSNKSETLPLPSNDEFDISDGHKKNVEDYLSRATQFSAESNNKSETYTPVAFPAKADEQVLRKEPEYKRNATRANHPEFNSFQDILKKDTDKRKKPYRDSEDINQKSARILSHNQAAPKKVSFSKLPSDKEEKVHKIAEQISDQNKAFKEKLERYSSKLKQNEKGDLLRDYAWIILLASLVVPAPLFFQDRLMFLAFTCLSFFLGIFFFIMAMRIVEISELIRWISSQMLVIQEKLQPKDD